MGFHFHSNFYQMVRLNLPLINPHITPFFLEEINGHEWIYNQISFFFIFEHRYNYSIMKYYASIIYGIAILTRFGEFCR